MIGRKIYNFLLGKGQSYTNSNVTPCSFLHKIPAAHTGCAPKKDRFYLFLIELKIYLRKRADQT